MKNLILTAGLAVGIALSPAARPAQANDGIDTIGLILGLGALAAIANEARKRDRKPAAKQYHHHKPKAQYGHAHGQKKKVYRPANRGHNRWTLPARCLREIRTPRGTRRALGAPCLRNNGVRVRSLPPRCRFEAGNGRGPAVYAARCLRREGYQIGKNGRKAANSRRYYDEWDD